MPTLENKTNSCCNKCDDPFPGIGVAKICNSYKCICHQEPPKECQHKTLDSKFPTCQHCLDCPWAKCHEDTEPPEEELNELIRDLTKVGSISKSEVKRRISQLLAKQKEEIKEKLKHIAMIDHGKEPKYFVKDVLKILD